MLHYAAVMAALLLGPCYEIIAQALEAGPLFMLQYVSISLSTMSYILAVSTVIVAGIMLWVSLLFPLLLAVFVRNLQRLAELFPMTTRCSFLHDAVPQNDTPHCTTRLGSARLGLTETPSELLATQTSISL